MNPADDAPAGMTTLGGTVATVVSVLTSVTRAPPAGAGPLSDTEACTDVPPVTVANPPTTGALSVVGPIESGSTTAPVTTFRPLCTIVAPAIAFSSTVVVLLGNPT